MSYSFSILIDGGTAPITLPDSWTIEYVDACQITYLNDHNTPTWLHPLDKDKLYVDIGYFIDEFTLTTAGRPSIYSTDPSQFLCGLPDYTVQGSYPWLTVRPEPVSLDRWEFHIAGPQSDFGLIG